MAYIFNSKIENPERLERMLVARRPLVDLLEKRANALIDKGTLSQTLLIGPRGSGKTHMLKVFFNRVWNNPKREEKIVVAYMVEDEYGIDTFLDLLIRIFNAFMRWYENDETKQLAEEIEKLKRTNPDQRESFAIDILNQYLNGRDLLIIVENLNDIFQGLGKEGQARLRDYIQQYNNTAIFASSQALFSDIQQEDKPFQNFFNITHLKKLSYEEAMLLVNALAEEEKLEDFKAFLDTPRGKANVHAVFDLTQGNHRLLVTFFDFLKAEFKSDLAEAFLHTIDKLKPYYESYFKLLSPQQQKIVQYLSSKRRPVTGKDISLNCFIPHTTASKQMSDLQKLGYVESTKVGKEAFYEIAEPMLRLAFEVNENKKGIISIFIDFVMRVYEVEEITKQYLKFKYLSKYVDGNLKIQYKKEATLYGEALKGNVSINLTKLESQLDKFSSKKEIVSYIRDLSLEQEKQKLEHEDQLARIKELYNSGELKEGLSYIENLQKFQPELPTEIILLKGFIQYQLEMDYESEKTLNEVIRLDYESHLALLTLGMISFRKKAFEDSINYLEKSLEIEPNQTIAWEGLSLVYIELEQFENAIPPLSKALEFSPNKASLWFSMGNCKYNFEQFDQAIFNFKKAVELEPNNHDFIFALGTAFGSAERYSEAEATFKKVLDLNTKDSLIFNYLGDSQFFQNKYAEAEKSYLKSLECDNTDYSTFLSLGILKLDTEDHSEAIKYLEQSLKLYKNDFDVYFNLSKAYEEIGNIKSAEQTLRDAIDNLIDNEEPWVELALFLMNNQKFEEANVVIKDYSNRFISSDFYFVATLLAILEGSEKTIKKRVSEWIILSNDKENLFLENFWELLKVALQRLNLNDLRTLEILPDLFNQNGRSEEISSYYSWILVYAFQKIENVGRENLKNLHNAIERSSINFELKQTWNLLLPIAISHYLDNDKKALLSLSKEERKSFLDFMKLKV